MSQQEYIDDLQEPLKKTPQIKGYLIPLWLIPVIGTIVVITHLVTTSKKALKHVEKVFGDFNEKYKTRGLSLKYAQTYQMTDKGNRKVDTMVITVKQPGVPIPGIPLFTLSKEGLIAVQAYQNGVQTGTPIAAAAVPPGMTPVASAANAAPAAAYATPTGFPSAEPSADMPAGFEIDPTAPYPYPM